MAFNQRQSRFDTQKSPAKRFLFILGIAFFLMYFVLGCMVIFWRQLPIPLSYNYRMAFGILLIVYAFFRFIRLVQNFRQ